MIRFKCWSTEEEETHPQKRLRLNCLWSMRGVLVIKPQRPVWGGLDVCKRVSGWNWQTERKKGDHRCSEKKRWNELVWEKNRDDSSHSWKKEHQEEQQQLPSLQSGFLHVCQNGESPQRPSFMVLQSHSLHVLKIDATDAISSVFFWSQSLFVCLTDVLLISTCP